MYNVYVSSLLMEHEKFVFVDKNLHFASQARESFR